MGRRALQVSPHFVNDLPMHGTLPAQGNAFPPSEVSAMQAGRSEQTGITIDRRTTPARLVVGPTLTATESADPSALRQTVGVLIGVVGIVLAYKYGVPQVPSVLSALWLPDSVLLCCLLFTPVRWSWIYILVSLATRFYFGRHLGLPLSLGIAG